MVVVAVVEEEEEEVAVTVSASVIRPCNQMAPAVKELSEPLLDALPISSSSDDPSWKEFAGERGSSSRQPHRDLQPEVHIVEKDVPMQQANIFSRLSFHWVRPLLKLGNSRVLELKDVPGIPAQDRAEKNVQDFLKAWNARKGQKRNPSVCRALLQCYWRDVLHTGFLAFLKGAGTVAGPIFLYFFVDFAAGNVAFAHEGPILAACLFVVKMIENFSQRHWYFGVRRLGMKVQSAVMAAVYEKELRLSSAGKRRHATGEIVNYISVDAYRLSELIWWMHWTWMVPFEIVVSLGILFAVVGLATIPGLILIILFILLITPLIMSMQSCQAEFMAAQDERLRATSEILSGMKVIKLQAWEDKFKGFISRMRALEFKWLTGTQQKRNYATILYWLMPTIVTAVVLITCILMNMTLTTTIVFTVLATFRIIQDPIRTVPDVLSAIIQAHVAFQRLDLFLQEEELPADAVKKDTHCFSEYAIRVDSATLSWDPEDLKPSLRNINLVVKRGEKLAICGAIGSGKSTLLYSILGEIPKLQGSVEVSGRVAYVAQSAWIQTGSVRDNILFGLPYDEGRYRNAVRACALEQDMKSFSHGDLTEIGERGINMSGGQKQRIQLARAVYNDADIYVLDDPFSAVDAQTAATLFHDCVMGALHQKTVLLVTHQVEFLPAMDSILVMQDGEIRQAGTYKDLLESGDAFLRLVRAHEEALHSVTGNGHSHPHEEEGGAGLQKVGSLLPRRLSREEILEKANRADASTQLVQEEGKESGDAGWKPYVDYILVAGGGLAIVGMVVTQFAFSAAQLYSNMWLATEVSNASISSSLLITVYGLVSTLSVLFFFFRSAIMVNLGLKASNSFFHGFTNAIMKAPMSFFDSTPSGRILNRASVDMSVLDLDIPFCFGFVLALVFDLLGIVIATAIATWEIILVVIPALLLVQYLQKYYAAAARELSRINSTTKAPIVNNSSETISGAATIRAFDMTRTFQKKNLVLIDDDASLYFHKHASLEWLIFRIELSCSVVVTAAALLVILKNNISPGFAGLAITYVLALNNCQIFLSWWQCMFAIFIVSVERIKQFMQLPMEAPAVIESNRPPAQWPSKGKVVLESLQIRYRENSPMVLKGITCSLEGGQKVGVVGRTGSGKTTLISAIFRLVEPCGGKIYIDDIDICSIGLHDLRFKLGIIPQEPVLFRGTVRTNLDPLNQYSDLEVWETLDKCQLGKVIRRLPLQLESPVADQGENWSAGQRQLFCLGRVLLKRSQVLVLDEATASIDSHTDALLQRLIRDEFSACTVITVAHRIPTVIDSDLVLALRDGYLVECAPPKRLIEQKASLFGQLVTEYWAQAGRDATSSKS